MKIFFIFLLSFNYLTAVYAEEYGLFQPDSFQSEQFEKIKKATVAIVKNENLNLIDVPIYGETYKFCGHENFSDEKLWSNCSGVLISKNTILTAGHCISNHKTCDDKSIVFDYNQNEDIKKIQNDSQLIYKCKKVLYWSHPLPQKQFVDFAIIQLDRDVVDRSPIQLSKNLLNKVEDIYSVGHPLGLPKKVSKGFVNKTNATANQDNKTSFYHTNLPTFAGLSGGGVYNSALELVGILVRGDNNFETDDGRCQRVLTCEKESCPKAEIQKLKVDFIKKYIK